MALAHAHAHLQIPQCIYIMHSVCSLHVHMHLLLHNYADAHANLHINLMSDRIRNVYICHHLCAPCTYTCTAHAHARLLCSCKGTLLLQSTHQFISIVHTRQIAHLQIPQCKYISRTGRTVCSSCSCNCSCKGTPHSWLQSKHQFISIVRTRQIAQLCRCKCKFTILCR